MDRQKPAATYEGYRAVAYPGVGNMRRLCVLAVLVLAGGCASPSYTLSGVPVGQQQVTMDRGVVSSLSAWQRSTVAVKAASADFQSKLGLWVVVQNRTNGPANFGTENVAVSTDGLSWLPVDTYEQMKARLDSNAVWKKLGAALISGIDMSLASQAGRSDYYGSYRSRFGTSTFHGTYVNRGEQYEAMSAASYRAAALNSAIDDQHDAQVASLDTTALRTTTVAPLADFGGLVAVDIPNLNRDATTPIFVRVSFLGEDHIFQFQAHKPGSYSPIAVDPAIIATEVSNTVSLDQQTPLVPAVYRQPDEAPHAASDALPDTDASPGLQRYDMWLKKHGGSNVQASNN
jgi:hypothetical protein